MNAPLGTDVAKLVLKDLSANRLRDMMEKAKHNLILKSLFLLLTIPADLALTAFLWPKADFHHPEFYLLASYGVAVLGLFLMSFFNLFRDFHFFPRKSDLIVLLMILSILQLVLNGLFFGMENLPSFPIRQMFEKAFLLSIFWFLTHSAVAQL